MLAMYGGAQSTVSIHAPAGGATPLWMGRPDLVTGFNPRTRGGCDVSSLIPFSPSSMFQSTHPRGVRLRMRRWMRCSSASFNPRTRGGCDQGYETVLRLKNWFQSTHPRGVRLLGAVPPKIRDLFQSTHPRGVRRACTPPRRVRCRFQSTHPRGVRRASSEWTGPRSPCFNPRTRGGCDADLLCGR